MFHPNVPGKFFFQLSDFRAHDKFAMLEDGFQAPFQYGQDALLLGF